MTDAEKQKLMSDVIRRYKNAHDRLGDLQTQAREWARTLREVADHLEEQATARHSVAIQLSPAITELPSIDDVANLSRHIVEGGRILQELEDDARQQGLPTYDR